MSQYLRPLSVIGVSAALAIAGATWGTEAPIAQAKSCKLPSQVVTIYFSARKYPNIRRHALAAIRKGWPSVLEINRVGASDRRKRLLAPIPTRKGYDRDEYPPAAGRGKGKSLERGSSPRGWQADVMYVPSRENRSHGSSLGGKMRKYCNGTRFRYGWN